MTGVLDPIVLEQENQRMGHVLVLLRTFVRRKNYFNQHSNRAEPLGSTEIDLEKVSVADFRCRCAWE